ncbi:MAG: M28 family peptidase [Terriglobia bacterium]
MAVSLPPIDRAQPRVYHLDMRRLLCLGLAATVILSAKTFSGTEALNLTAKVVAFGPRPAGSANLAKLRTFIKRELAARGSAVVSDTFTGQTPDGPIQMENIIAKFPGKSGRAIAISGHYDTGTESSTGKKMTDFVGANDGGSSTGFLLELAAVLQGRPHPDDIYLIFFDGEEAVRSWSDTDSLYGSRHLAEKWSKDGTNARLKALINVDMIGDKNFKIVWETNSAASLRTLVWDAADSLGYKAYFPREGGPVGDDHMPFLNAGVRALDLIDFESQSSFWHTPQDTMDKLSAHSFEVMGTLLVKVIGQLEQQK